MGMLEGKAALVTGAGRGIGRGIAIALGQVFHAFGYGYTLLAQPVAVRSIRGDKRWDPEELARIFPTTLGAKLSLPPSVEFGRTLDQRPASEWSALPGSGRFWKLSWDGA